VPTVRDRFERSLTSFDAWAPTRFGPDWGRAEALTGLAAMYLAAGELRQARDLIENALIEAPEYRVALELKKELLLQR
jgi:Tfp pilus assembly protein PilF